MKTLFLSLLVLSLISTTLATPSNDLLPKTFRTSREREMLRRGFTESSKPKPKGISISTSAKKARAATG